ncbi:hypothetical protein BOW31_12670 [Solemya velum gill symbiont]|nr:hypothetical protein BOW31_12670 [Solemya velum gill symbiont]
MSDHVESACYEFVTRTHSLPVTLWQYVDFEKRLNSFKDWPRYLPGPTARQLARSGFVYLGTSDRVRCFSCGVIVNRWELTDEAEKEHYRWSQECAYLRMIAGPR